MKPRWTWAAAFLLVGAAGTAVRADELDDRAQDVVDALRGGDVAAAVTVLEDPAITSDLAGRPALVHVICDRAYRFDEACRAAPAAARMMLATVLMEVAEDARRRAPADPRAAWALSNAIVVRERSGLPEGAAAWQRAADLLVEAHATAPGDGEALGYAVTFLIEGAALESDARRDLMKRAGTIAGDIRRAHGDVRSVAEMVASAHVWAARTFLADDKRTAKEAVATTFDTLRPFVKDPSAPLSSSSLWNDAVTIDLERHFTLREHYITRPESALDGALEFDVPVSARWTVTKVPATEDSAAYEYVTQTGADGETVRQILFRSYAWGGKYPFDGPNDVSGDNVKGIARGLQAISTERVFAPDAHETAPKKGKFGNDFSGYRFDVTGHEAGDDGRALGLHGFCGRSGRQATVVVLVYVYTEDGEPDAETQAVVDSMREPG